jgi:hypothetical protein
MMLILAAITQQDAAEAMERIFLSFDSIPLTENYIQQLEIAVASSAG